MNKIIKNMLKIIGVYAVNLILTVIVFYITGMYIWTTPPTKLVLTRMIVFPIFLTIAIITFIWLIKKFRK